MSKLPFPERVLQQHIATLGKTGAGKSSAMRVIAEHLLERNARVCIVDPKGDWWGLKSSADGKGPGFPIIAFGNFKEERATDVPINERSGKHVAELIATGNRPAVIGFRGWMPSQMLTFWLDFAPAVFNLNQGDLRMFIDEIHNFAAKGKILDPQAGKSIHWTNRIMSEGRGLGLTFYIASQRAQKVHNDTLDCCETLCAMRVAHPAARQSVKEWIDGNGDKETGKTVLETLASLKRGEAWVWSPENSFGPERVQFPMFETFDSFAPPQLQKKVNQAGWSEVNLDQVREKLASVIAEAKANDPKELKAEIAKLKQELAKKRIDVTTSQPVVDEKAIERAVAAAVKPYRDQLKKIGNCAAVGFRLFDEFRTGQSTIFESLKEFASAEELAAPIQPFVARPAHAIPGSYAQPTIPPRKPAAAHTNGDSELSGPQMSMLSRLAEFHAIGRAEVNLAWLAGSLGTTVRARGFEENLRKVRTLSFVEVSGGKAKLTREGEAIAGEPSTVWNVRDKLREMLSGPQDELLATLDQVYPHGMQLETLAATHNTTVRARGFEENLRFLRSNEIIEVSQGVAKRAEWVA